MNHVNFKERIIPVPNAFGTVDAIHVTGPASYLAVRRRRDGAVSTSTIVARPFPDELTARMALAGKRS